MCLLQEIKLDFLIFKKHLKEQRQMLNLAIIIEMHHYFSKSIHQLIFMHDWVSSYNERRKPFHKFVLDGRYGRILPLQKLT